MDNINKLLEMSAASIVKNTNDVVVILDKTGNILFLNDRVESWLGYLKDELVGKNIAFAGLLSAGSLKVALQNLALRFLGKEVAPYTVDFISKDKGVMTSTIKGDLIKDETGKVLGDLVLITDISEKEEYKKALKLEQEKIDVYIDIVGTMVVVLDTEGKIKLLNKKACEVLKIKKEDAVGKDWFETFIPEVDRVKTKEAFTKIVSGVLEGTEKFENKIITSEGTERLISWHNTFLKDEKGNVTATVASGEDVTERNALEQENIKKTQDLERINQLMIGREIKMVGLKKEIEKLKGSDK